MGAERSTKIQRCCTTSPVLARSYRSLAPSPHGPVPGSPTWSQPPCRICPARTEMQARRATLAWLAAGREAPFTLSEMMRTANSLCLESPVFRSATRVGSRLLPGPLVDGGHRSCRISPCRCFVVEWRPPTHVCPTAPTASLPCLWCATWTASKPSPLASHTFPCCYICALTCRCPRYKCPGYQLQAASNLVGIPWLRCHNVGPGRTMVIRPPDSEENAIWELHRDQT